MKRPILQIATILGISALVAAQSGRVAQPLNRRSEIRVGAPLLRFVQGRVRCCWQRRVWLVTLLHRRICTSAAAAKALEVCVRGTHPCKVRKDGAPSVVVISARTKGWATRPGL
jgi:hypothetical protein